MVTGVSTSRTSISSTTAGCPAAATLIETNPSGTPESAKEPSEPVLTS